MDRSGYKTAYEHNGFGGKCEAIQRAKQHKERAIALHEYDVPNSRARFRADAKLRRDPTFDTEVMWTHNNEAGSRGHAVPNKTVHGTQSKAIARKKMLEDKALSADERQRWLQQHNKDLRAQTTSETSSYDPSLGWMQSDAQTAWAQRKAGEKGHSDPNSSVPMEREVTEDVEEYQPTPGDLAVQLEDYSKSEAQLDFELRKAFNDGDGDRVSAIKIVKALRDGPVKQVAKRPHARGTMAAIRDWLDE